MQRCLNQESFAQLDDAPDVNVSIWVSFAEIYNEHVFDLLRQDNERKNLRFGMVNGQVFIKDLTCVNVTTGLEAYLILQYGLHRLR